MKKTSILFSVLLICIGSLAQSSSAEFNFGFEKFNSINGLPDKWFQWGSGYNLKIDTIIRRSGRASVLITPVQKTPDNFGSVAYAIPSQYEAENIELQAYMKLDNVADGTIGLMIRIDGAAGTIGFNNMMQENIRG